MSHLVNKQREIIDQRKGNRSDWSILSKTCRIAAKEVTIMSAAERR